MNIEDTTYPRVSVLSCTASGVGTSQLYIITVTIFTGATIFITVTTLYSLRDATMCDNSHRIRKCELALSFTAALVALVTCFPCVQAGFSKLPVAQSIVHLLSITTTAIETICHEIEVAWSHF